MLIIGFTIINLQSTMLNPGAEQGGLAKSGRRGDKDQLTSQTRIQAGEQGRPGNERCARPGKISFCDQQRIIHGGSPAGFLKNHPFWVIQPAIPGYHYDYSTLSRIQGLI